MDKKYLNYLINYKYFTYGCFELNFHAKLINIYVNFVKFNIFFLFQN